jgi:hypothetical protein
MAISAVRLAEGEPNNRIATIEFVKSLSHRRDELNLLGDVM